MKTLLKISNLFMVSILNLILFSHHAFCVEEFNLPEVDITSELEYQHPVIIYPDTISICFMPFRGSDKASDNSGYQDFIVKKLLELDHFNYKVFRPDKYDLEYVYPIGFIERSYPKRITKLYPIADFWRKKEIMYVVFGSYKFASDGRLTIEAFLHDSAKDKNIIRKKYKGTLSELDRILEKIANQISDELKKYHIPRDAYDKEDTN